MATSLPTNNDATYPDDGSASRKVHQQHHDAIHGYTNTHDGAADPHPQYLTAAEGAAAYAAISAESAWVAYTPTLTNMALGNGTIVARYKQIGKTVHAMVTLTLGTTSTVGTDATISFPVTPKGSANLHGVGRFLDISGNVAFAGWWREPAGVLGCNTGGGNFGNLTAATPFVWANTDVIVVSVTYEAT